MKKILLLLFIVCILRGGCHAGITSLYYGGGIVSLDQPEVDIEKIYGLRFLPVNITVKSLEPEVYILHSVENLGNITTQVTIEITSFSGAKGWGAELIVDRNRNGRHEDWENERLKRPLQLAEGATISFFLRMTRPPDYKYGDSGYAIIKVEGIMKDGVGYVGYNGVSYGGPDEAESTDTVIIK